MKYFIQLLFIVVFVNFAKGQIIIEKTINIQANTIYADMFDNLYVLSDDALTKFNSEGEKLASFFSDGGEEISFCDTRNPFKLILFFEDQNKIILLDNKLTKINKEISLNKYNIYGDALISGATIGGYWVFDNIKKQILKLNSDFKLEYKRDISSNSKIISITDNSTNVFLYKSSGDLMSYNYNTSLNENLPIYKLNKNFKIRNNEVIHYSSNNHSIKIENILKERVSYINLPPKIYVRGATMGNSKVFFYDKTKVYISSVNSNIRKSETD